MYEAMNAISTALLRQGINPARVRVVLLFEDNADRDKVQAQVDAGQRVIQSARPALRGPKPNRVTISGMGLDLYRDGPAPAPAPRLPYDQAVLSRPKGACYCDLDDKACYEKGHWNPLP